MSYYLRRMQPMKMLSVLMALLVIGACFFPWVTIPSKNIAIGGFFADLPTYGKPGLFHLLFSSIFILLVLTGKLWSVRVAFFVGAFNIAWAIRNFVAISACSGGICPVKQPALYVVLFSSLLMVFFAALISVRPSMKKD
jgi:hypothetical protein